MSDHAKHHADLSGLIKLKQCAELMAMRPATLRKLVNGGKVPCVRINARTWRFHWPTVLKSLSQN